MKKFLLPAALPLLMFSAAHAAPEVTIIDSVIIWGQLDCYGKMSARCGGIDLEFLSDRYWRGQPDSGAEEGRSNWQQRTKKAAPKSEQNSNKKSEEDCKSTNNPVLIATGEKHKDELDFSSAGRYGFALQRTYRSMLATGTLFGRNWPSSLDSIRLEPSDYFRPRSNWPSVPRTVTVIEPDGTKFAYEYHSASSPESVAPGMTRETSEPDPGADAKEVPGIPEAYFYRVKDAAKTGVLTYMLGEGWNLARDKTLFHFNQSRQVQKVFDSARKLRLTYTYDATPAQRLERITNAVGQSVKLRWGANGRVDEIRDPADRVWFYEYDGNGMLAKVTSPGDSPDVRTYHYESSDASLLTGISINGMRYSTYDYHPDRRVKTSGLAGGEVLDTIDYGDKVTYVTDARGQTTKYTHYDLQGELKVNSVVREATSTCSQSSKITVYDSNGYVDFMRDWNGNKTDYTYDATGRLQSVTTAAETADALTTTHYWHNQDIVRTDLINSEGAAYLRINYHFHPSGPEAGRIAAVVQTDVQTGATRTTNYGYTYYVNGTIATETAAVVLPEGSANTIVYYDTHGNVSAVTNPLNQTTTWSGHNGLGQPARKVDSNGVATDYTYNPIGTVDAINQAGVGNTKYIYNHSRQPLSINTATGQVVRFKYNSAGRTEYVGNALDEYVRTAIDVAANSVTQTSTLKTPSFNGAVLSGTFAGEFRSTTKLDSLGRPFTATGNDGQRVEYRYDGNGNVLTSTDAANRTTRFEYDAQNRVVKTTLPDGSETETLYDTSGRLEHVIDARKLRTTYTYNGFGDRTSVTSPDTGYTKYEYDSAGRLSTETRADGKVVSYAWDAFGRLRSRWGTSIAEQYNFDEGEYGKGRLTSFSDWTGRTEYSYNAAGQILSQVNHIYGLVYKTSWEYDTVGRLSGMTYPNGVYLSYQYDPQGRLSKVNSNLSGIWATLVDSFLYQPATDVPYAWRFGNGLPRMLTLDKDGRLGQLSTPGKHSLSFAFWNTSTISSVTDEVNPFLTTSYEYDVR